jgi:hypothetical protein
MKTLCECAPCRKRRQNNRRWYHGLPPRKRQARITQSNAIRAKGQASDEELDLRATKWLEMNP